MSTNNGMTADEFGTWSVVEHSWSDTSVVGPEGTIVTLSIYDEATEETQHDLEDRMAKRARLIAASPSLYKALADAPDIMAMQPEEFYIAYTEWLTRARTALKLAMGDEG